MTAPDPAGEERIRVVVATWGEDDADRVTMSVARGLRDAGVEVVHAGRLLPEALGRGHGGGVRRSRHACTVSSA